jgi:hypothetical protein
MAARPQPVFRFMDLPVELRLMVYEFFPITTRHYVIYTRKSKRARPEHERPSLTVINLQVSVQVLRVCRTVQNEAQATMMSKIQRIKEQTPRIIVDSGATTLFSLKNGVLTHLTHWFRTLRDDKGANFDHWVRQRKVKFPSEVRRFIRQAGIQMMNRWQKLEYFHSKSHANAKATLFLACRMRISSCDKFWSDREATVGSFFSQEVIEEVIRRLPAYLNELSLCGGRSFDSSPSYPFGGIISAIVWSVPVYAEQEAQPSNMEITSADLWAYLAMGRGWDVGEEME